MEFAEKMCFWMLKTSFDIAIKIMIFLITIMLKYGFALIIAYFKNAIKGFVKVLCNPRNAIIALPICLISPLDAKFFVGYTFGGAEYAPYVHLVIILSPFIYFYFLGKVDIVIVPEERFKIKIEKPNEPKNEPEKEKSKKQSKKQSKKNPRIVTSPHVEPIDKIETLSGSGTDGFMKRVKNIKTKDGVKQ
jgi:hypothetical protein